jgi:hypothetical protein
MAKHIPPLHQNHPTIQLPEYRVVAFLDGLTLIATISEVEAYFQDIVVAVLLRHPLKMGKLSFELKGILDMSSIADVVRAAAERYASEMLFKSPKDYKKDLMNVLSAGESIFTDSWPAFVEAKARRDIGVHNGWIVNDVYRSKVREVGLTPPQEPALTGNHEYLQVVRSSCVDLMGKLAHHCASEFA